MGKLDNVSKEALDTLERLIKYGWSMEDINEYLGKAQKLKLTREQEEEIEKPDYKFEARIKQTVKTNIVMAFGGCEYVKNQWNPIPRDDKIEAQAKDHKLLVVRKIENEEVK